jgi:Membrane GTPase LepA
VIGIDASDDALVSAKTGLGVDFLLEKLVKVIPPPEGNPELPLSSINYRFLV